MKKKFLGIDPGTSDYNCAYAVYDGKDIIEFGTIDLRKTKTFAKRLTKIARELTDIIERQEITDLAYEAFFLQKGKIQGSVRIPMLIGVLLHYADIYNLRYMDIFPSQMKKIVSGSGRASKEEVQAALEEDFNLPSDISNHESDAIGIARTAYELSQHIPLSTTRAKKSRKSTSR